MWRRRSISGSSRRCGTNRDCANTCRKTMSEGLRGVVVAHGGLAQALVEEAERISGQAGVLTPVSNQGGGRDEIEARLHTAVAGQPAVVFVDMPCGSCFFAAMRLSKL